MGVKGESWHKTHHGGEYKEGGKYGIPRPWFIDNNPHNCRPRMEGCNEEVGEEAGQGYADGEGGVAPT